MEEMWDDDENNDQPMKRNTSNDYYKASYEHCDRNNPSTSRSNRENVYENRNYNNQSRNRRTESSNTQSINIDSNYVGLIIGKSGSNIRDMSSRHNVDVQIDKNSAAGTAKVHVSGNKQDVDNAVSEINSQIDDKKRKNEKYENKFQSKQLPKSYSPPPSSFEDNSSYIISEEEMKAAIKRCEDAEREKWSVCPPLIKHFYEEHSEIRKMTDDQIENLRKGKNGITVQRIITKENQEVKPIPRLITKFEHCFEKYPDLMEQLKQQGFENPSPIQCQAWPVLLSGEDMIGIAQTGTGKTLAFLLPAFIHTEGQPVPLDSRKGPNVLVLSPTRELALQIHSEVNKYSFRGMKSLCVYGGADRSAQINALADNVQIVIATPGRLNDLAEAGCIDLRSVTFLILDEADRMLDMGFEPQIRKLLLDIRSDRQTVLTTATWPFSVRNLAKTLLNNPIQVCVGTLDLTATATVTQIVEMVDEDDKYSKLKQFIESMDEDEKIIVFCSKRARVQSLASDLSCDGLNVTAIHGASHQSDREQALDDIKSGYCKVLIGSDLASRGLDIADISHVINFDFPTNIEEYVHRVGRTGRAGKSGKAITYMTRGDWKYAENLINILQKGNQEIPRELFAMAERYKLKKESMGDNPRGRKRY